MTDKEHNQPELDLEADTTIEHDRKAPMVSVKVERKLNLGDYNSVTVQAFAASGTLDHHTQLLDENGEIMEDARNALTTAAQELGAKLRDQVIQALKQQESIEIEVKER